MSVVIILIMATLSVDLWEPEAFHSPKMLWLVILIPITLGGTIIGHLRHPLSFIPILKNRTIQLASFLFLVVMASSIFSVSPCLSFTSDHYRNQGWWLWLGSLVVFVSTASATPRIRFRLYYALEMVTVIVALWIIGQKIGWLQGFSAQYSSARPPGPLGSAQYTAEWLSLVFFVLLASHAKRSKAKNLFLAILVLGALAVTKSRAPWIGLAAGSLFLIIARLAYHNRKRQAFSLLLMLCLMFTSWFWFSTKHSPSSSGTSLFGRFADMFDSKAAAADMRLVYWRDSHRIVQNQLTDSPIRALFGFGPETLKLVYGPYMTIRVPLVEAGRHPFAAPYHSHNQFLDLFRDIGLLGFLGFNSLLGLSLWRGFCALGWNKSGEWLVLGCAGILMGGMTVRHFYGEGSQWTGAYMGLIASAIFFPLFHPTKRWNFEILGLIAGLLGFVVTMQFGFLTPGTKLLLWVCAGLLIALTSDELEARPIPVYEGPDISFLLKGLCSLTLIFGISSHTSLTPIDQDSVWHTLSQRQTVWLLLTLLAVHLWPPRKGAFSLILLLWLLITLLSGILSRTNSDLSLADLRSYHRIYLIVRMGSEIIVIILILKNSATYLSRGANTLMAVVAIIACVFSIRFVSHTESKYLFQVALSSDEVKVSEAIFDEVLAGVHRPLWYMFAGDKSMEVGDLGQAATYYRTAIELEPENPLYIAKLISAKTAEFRQFPFGVERDQRTDDIENLYARLAALTSNYPVTWTNWAAFVLSLPDPKRAYDLGVYASTLTEPEIYYTPTWIVIGDAAFLLAQVTPERAEDYISTAQTAYSLSMIAGQNPEVEQRLEATFRLCHSLGLSCD